MFISFYFAPQAELIEAAMCVSSASEDLGGPGKNFKMQNIIKNSLKGFQEYIFDPQNLQDHK
jgi:hypothetical protein